MSFEIQICEAIKLYSLVFHIFNLNCTRTKEILFTFQDNFGQSKKKKLSFSSFSLIFQVILKHNLLFCPCNTKYYYVFLLMASGVGGEEE